LSESKGRKTEATQKPPALYRDTDQCHRSRELASALRLISKGLSAVADALQADSAHTESGQPNYLDERRHMRADEFGKLVSLSARRVRDKLRSNGIHGVHYHMDGRSFLVHVIQAEELLSKGGSTTGGRLSLPMTPPTDVDELTQFRAKAARRKQAK